MDDLDVNSRQCRKFDNPVVRSGDSTRSEKCVVSSECCHWTCLPVVAVGVRYRVRCVPNVEG